MNFKKNILKRTFGYFDENYDGICLKYIPVLNSDILLHPYYKFPPIKDPEILSINFNVSNTKLIQNIFIYQSSVEI